MIMNLNRPAAQKEGAKNDLCVFSAFFFSFEI